jgi:hypothetical protein
VPPSKVAANKAVSCLIGAVRATDCAKAGKKRDGRVTAGRRSGKALVDGVLVDAWAKAPVTTGVRLVP